ncbi:MAG: aminotransferase class V-fold PLP-dependent enzyme [Phycisphaeraceae bacterium]|nr:MAG: aminotransferase class V-fold PLP-dependent enzyme [Phycisphaeraceae bacterium]
MRTAADNARSGTALAAHWTIDPAVSYLNHGSFGATPKHVIEFQQTMRDRMERQGVRFFVRDLEGLLDSARAELGAFLGADADDLAFISNATTGVNAVLRSLDFGPGDELLTTNQEYNACANALRYIAERSGATPVVAEIPFPIASPDQVVEAVLSMVTDRTRIALLDHVTSQTGLVFPIERLVRELEARGVDTLVDGAHSPGMVEVDIDRLGAAYYTGNLHKWVCAPKGAAFLHVRRDRQERIRPAIISHGANSPRTDRSRFRVEFDWMGTDDPTAWLAAPEAIRFMGSLLPGGWDEVRRRNRELCLASRRVLCERLGVAIPAPEEMIGSIASIPLVDGADAPQPSALFLDPMQDVLLEEFGIEVPVIPWPAPPKRLLRISAQLYNEASEYERLATAVERALEGERTTT